MIEREQILGSYMLIALMVALILRLSVPLIAFSTTQDKTTFHTSDTIGYVEPAMNLMSEGEFSRGGMPEINRTPGYPIFLISGLALGRLELVTIALQIILSCLTVFLVYQIALKLFERVDVAILAAALYTLEPLSIVYTSLMMTETLFAFLVMLAIYFLVRYLANAKLKYFCAAAIVLSAAAYVRPVAYFLPTIIVIGMLAISVVRKEVNWKLLIHICVFLLISMAPILAWQARNSVVAGYSGFSAQRDEFLSALGQAVAARSQGISVIEQEKRSGWSFWSGPERYYAQHPEDRWLDEADLHRRRGNEGLRLIMENPWNYLVIHARGAMLMAGLTGFGAWLNLFKVRNPDSPFYAGLRSPSFLGFMPALAAAKKTVFWGNLFLGIALLIYWLLAFYALTFRKVRSEVGLILAVLMGAYFLLAPAAWPDSRYRHPVMPIVCVLAGYGLHVVVSKIRWRKHVEPSPQAV